VITLGKICFAEYCLANSSYVYYIAPIFLVLLILLWINFVGFKKKEEKEVL